MSNTKNSEVVKTEKKKFKLPHTYVIIFMLLMLASALTWLIPAGKFAKVKNASGISVAVPGKFSFIASTPVNPFEIPYRIVQTLNSSSSLIFIILIVGGAFQVIISTGMFQAFTARLARKFAGRESLLIPAFTIIFAAACTVEGVNVFIGFAPIGVMIARSMGYDAIVGVAMIMLGGAIGFSTGTFNPNTTGIAQNIAELPMFSGLGYRVFSLVVFLIVTNIYLIRYAKRVKADPKTSVVYDLEQQEKDMVNDISNLPDIQPRHYLVLAVVIVCYGLIVYGGTYWDWDFNNNSTVFMWMAVLGGLAGGLTPSKIATEFLAGAKKLIFAALVIGMARTMANILEAGKVLDTVVYALSGLLSIIPGAFQGAAMYLIHLAMNFFVSSGSAQAGITMPIMVPVADVVGMTRQSAVLAFNFGDGFGNYIVPTSSALMGFLGVANIPYEKWMKFVGKLFGLWVLTGCALLVVAYFIHYGPF